jgi:dTDP-4-dehydrorhamnose reductase
MSEKILILGAKGNLGVQLQKIFESEYEVIAWDREEIDITDKELILKKVDDLKPRIIINAAAFNAVDKCEEPEGFEAAKKLNVDAVGYLAQASLRVGAIFAQYSSDYIFDGKKSAGYKENDEPKPINKYGETKLLGEKEILKLSSQGLKWYIIRTQKLFGPKGKSQAAKPSFFDIIMKIANENELNASSTFSGQANKTNEIKVVSEEKGRFTYTPDLARATKELIESEMAWGIYHIANSFACNWHRAAVELFKILGNKNVKLIPVPSSNFPRPAKRPKYSELLNTKLPELRDWREALREYLSL